jgi:MFS transporter, SHS family, sialic acid transporter
MSTTSPYASPKSTEPSPPKSIDPSEGSGITTRGQWMALAAALLGWMFDGAEMGVFSMVGRQAIADLLQTTDEAVLGRWFGVITAGFLIGAATGGVLFGWLGDRIGRVRAMTLSVLTYALFTGMCGFCTQAWQVGALRFIAALGMGGEWSLGVALVMEVWPNRSRAFMAGLIGAAANVGYLLVGFVGLGLAAVLSHLADGLLSMGLSQDLVNTLVANKGWRLMMILGTVPALLTFFIRLFVPESEKWQAEETKGRTNNWETTDLFGVLLGAAGPGLMVYLWSTEHSGAVRVVGTLFCLAVAIGGYSFPMLRYLQRQALAHDGGELPWRPVLARMLLAASLSGVALLGTWGSTQWGPTWADKLTGGAQNAKEYTQIWLAVGAIAGTIAAAMMGDWLGRRLTYCAMCITSIASILWFFQPWTKVEYGNVFLFNTFLAGFCTASFYGWLPLYLPELFRTNVRASGQGFSFNFGRILAAVGTLKVGDLLKEFSGGANLFGIELTGGYPLACSSVIAIYLLGLGLIWLAPETKGKPLPD